MKRLVTLVTVIVLCIALLPIGLAYAANNQAENFRATTADGASIALKRYRPEAGAPFNDRAQPVVFMPGASANFNEFDIRTPEGKSYNVTLPANLPDWARDDPYIARDPMKFYSVAYYLYDHGYDVWLANYRGQGRAPNRSSSAWNAALDQFGIYDVDAAVRLVRRVTGKKPVYVGHSMGCTIALIYLQGAVFQGGWNPHVVSDPAQVAERNGGEGPGALKGLVDLDGPLTPATKIAVPDIAWLAMLFPIYINLRPVSKLVGEGVAEPVMFIEQVLWAIRQCLPPELDDLLAGLYAINPANMDINVLKYMAACVLDGLPTHAAAQFTDGIKYNCLREYYRNGFLGRLRIVPPPPAPGDGFYYYSDNLAKISLPSLTLMDGTLDLTDPADVRKFYDRKTRNPLDECRLMTGTAHVDLVDGLSAPFETFPAIGNWLDRLCGLQNRTSETRKRSAGRPNPLGVAIDYAGDWKGRSKLLRKGA
jgi:pimeloyl-ACP methyl ester carboxylesterase